MDVSSDSPWLYFLAGALLPTLALVFLRPTTTSSVETKKKNDEEEEEDYDDDEEDDEDEDLVGVTTDGPSSSWGYKHSPYKMVLCVNQGLSMGKGKIAAQCCHAAVACYKRAAKQCPSALAAWEHTGCAKIALKCPNQEEMEIIAALAMSKDIPLYLVEDAGRTQIAAGSRTVLGLFGPASVFEGVTDHLKLM
jgi:PTH2 family peptidyl-tRNA hydrolase